MQNDSTTAGLVYADGNTFTGSDPNPRVDEDDEIALMVKDFGGNPTSTVPPAGVDADFVVRFAVRDGTAAGYVFAFRDSSHATTRSTGDYVTYDFGLTSGDYRTTYDFRGIDDNGTEFANPEKFNGDRRFVHETLFFALDQRRSQPHSRWRARPEPHRDAQRAVRTGVCSQRGNVRVGGRRVRCEYRWPCARYSRPPWKQQRTYN
ncbi:MAG: hypothetical protein IPK60_16805 [Sandaracinaceae bacterium]|nr:hypothetical protein [Sandaracinaceae bacterium]